ncbi:glycosyltransferase family 39 protein [Nocardioides coralli]|uniref:glycosyltransferase family 39 protein n=1 Tax=Nocardioides coralli TaxID=2872154 RepID=UPI001CA4243A|nr:glycosyltransferase family 39 protein [Nocardioides coralli]QZY28496.1 glycosyltransferase family 39 protein [Nocardioides coralli]
MHQQRSGAVRGLGSRLRIDPWGPLLAAAGVVIFLLHGFGGVLTRDLALYSYSAQQFAEGVPPYVSVLNRAGPLAHMVPGAGVAFARLVGTDDLLTMRVLMLVLSAIAVWLIYLLGRDAFASRLAGAATAASLLSFQGFVTYAGGGPREKTTMLLLVVCALLATTHRRWALAGAATALATLTWQPSFFVGTAAVVVAVLGLTWRQAPAALVRFAVGGLIPTAVITSYFWGAGALRQFLDGFYFINAGWTDQTGLAEFVTGRPEEMVEGFGQSLWLVIAGLVAMLVLGVVQLLRRERSDPRWWAVLSLSGATVAILLWSVRVFNGWADAVVMLPLAALGLGGLLHRLVRSRPRWLATTVVATYTLVLLVSSGVSSWVTRPAELGPMRAEIDAALAAAGPDVTVLSIGAPQPLVFGQLRNPIRHQMFIDGLNEYLDDDLPRGLQGLAERIAVERPTFVTMDEPTWYDWARPVIREHYVYVGQTYDMVWYVDNRIGPERIARLERVIGGAA